MKIKVSLIVLLTAAILLSSCAVGRYPRKTLFRDEAETNIAYHVDNAAAWQRAKKNTGRKYKLERQLFKVDWGYYLDLDFKKDPRSFYVLPKAPPEIKFVKVLKETKHYTVRLFKWDSQYKPRSPNFARVYKGYVENQVAWGVYVKSKHKNRAAMVISHGWTKKKIQKIWKDEGLIELAKIGYDSILIQQPYHGLRAPADSVYSGEFFFSGEASHVNEAVCQSVTDIISMVLLLRKDYEVVGAKGTSLGGTTTLQTVAVTDALDFAIAWKPQSSLGKIPEETKYTPYIADGVYASGIDKVLLQEIVNLSSPPAFQPMLLVEDILLFAGMGDAFVPPDQPKEIWIEWGQPQIYWYAGGHVLNFEKKRCRKIENKFLKDHLPRSKKRR